MFRSAPGDAEGSEVGFKPIKPEKGDPRVRIHGGWGDADKGASVENDGGREQNKNEGKSEARPKEAGSGDEVGETGGDGDGLLLRLIVVVSAAVVAADVCRHPPCGVHPVQDYVSLHCLGREGE